MKIIVDIGHPAHVHYFKNALNILKEQGHEVFIFARRREFIFELLTAYNFTYYDRGYGSNNFLGKFFYMVKSTIKMYFISRKIHPDILLSFSSPYLAQVSSLLGKPHIALKTGFYRLCNPQRLSIACSKL